MSAGGAGMLAPLPRGKAGLRFSVAPDLLALLQQAPLIQQHARNRGVVHRLETIYYDTADHALFGGGLSLRVQRHGRRFTQRLRRHGPHPAAKMGGTEPVSRSWETPVDGPVPDLARLAGAEQALLEPLSAAPLLALFETRLRRQVRRLDLSGALVDISFDSGVIEAQSRQEEMAGLGLSLRSGEFGLLCDFALRLLELAPLRIAPGNTVRRGYALASGTAPRAQKAAPSTLFPDMAADDMIGAVLCGCQSHLQANQLAAADGSRPEGVHQMRVALRRMRSALTLLRREIASPTMASLGAEAKWAANELGPARGWDVFLGTTLSGPQRWGRPGTDFDALRQVAQAPRAASYRAVRELIDSPRYARFQLSLLRWIERRGWRNEVDRDGLAVLAEPAAVMALRVLTRLHRRALKQGAHFRRLSATERHELRITLKKLRYAAEFFLPLCPDPSNSVRFLARLGRLQDALGLDHDAATTQPLLDEAASASSSPGVQQAIGLVIGWHARDCLAAGKTLEKQWRRFKRTPTFWARPAAMPRIAPQSPG